MTQDETVFSLNSLKANYIERIDKLSNERNSLKKELDNLKFEKADIQTRKQIDEVSVRHLKFHARSRKLPTTSQSNARGTS